MKNSNTLTRKCKCGTSYLKPRIDNGLCPECEDALREKNAEHIRRTTSMRGKVMVPIYDENSPGRPVRTWVVKEADCDQDEVRKDALRVYSKNQI